MIWQVLRIPTGSLPIEDLHWQKIKKISCKQWINHFKETWDNFFHEGIKTIILFFKTVFYVTQMIQSGSAPDSEWSFLQSSVFLTDQIFVSSDIFPAEKYYLIGLYSVGTLVPLAPLTPALITPIAKLVLHHLGKT